MTIEEPTIKTSIRLIGEKYNAVIHLSAANLSKENINILGETALSKLIFFHNNTRRLITLTV